MSIKLPSSLRTLTACLAIFSFTACGHDDHDHDHDHENELITTVTLTFTPEAGGTPLTFVFDDPDGDGGAAPTVDDIALTPGQYDLTVSFVNGLENPPEDITEEISDESQTHQVFFTGDAVDGPATANAGAALAHAYEDQDANGLAIGLDNSVNAIAGSGELVITLRHMPEVGEEPVKTADVAEQVASGGFAAIGGSSDASVTFAVVVQ